MTLAETVARAMYEAQPRKPSWAALTSWADGSAATAKPGTIAANAARTRGEAAFDEAREERNHWLQLAEVAIAAMEAAKP